MSALTTEWTNWISPRMDEYRIKCCDCGLEHLVEFRVLNGAVQFRAKRSGGQDAVQRQAKAPIPSR